MLNWLPRQDNIFAVTNTHPDISFDVAIFNTLADAMRTAYNVANDIELNQNGISFTNRHEDLLSIIEGEEHIDNLPHLVTEGLEKSLGPQFEVLYNVYLDYFNGTYGLTVQIGKL
jgi:hypothetical protein